MACAESVSGAEVSSPEIIEPSIVDFIGDFSVYGKCPKYDWNTGILRISKDYISITETGCEIKKVTREFSSNSFLLEFQSCHAEGKPIPDERARLSVSGDIKTLQYLPNADGVLNGDGRVFELTPCARDTKE